MIFHRLGLINKNQKGFTLMELMLAMAIGSIIIGAITMTIFQVVEGNARTSNHMTAVRQVQNAGYWVSHDTVMAQIVVVDEDEDTGFPLTLTWTEWGSNEVHQVVYSLADNELQRSHSINGNGAPEIDIIAQFINPDPEKTKCEFTSGVLTFSVTATVGTSSRERSETRIYETVPRPGS